MGTNTIDQTVSQNSTNNNLTHYFSVMSMGHFKIIGNFYHKITTNTRDEYINIGYQRGKINRQILEEMYNTDFNFSSYDNWTKNGEYDNQWGADNEIDMICMVYRNIGEDKPNPAYTATQLGFGNAYSEDGI